MARTNKKSLERLLRFLRQEIDRRYKDKNAGPWRTDKKFTGELMAQSDHWFTLTRLLEMTEVQRVLKSFLDLKRPLGQAKESVDFLRNEFETVNGDHLFNMTRCGDSERLGYLIWMFLWSMKRGERNAGGRPRTAKNRNELVHRVTNDLGCHPSDALFWPTFCARAENEYIAIPNHRGLDRYKWLSLREDPNRQTEWNTAKETTIRMYREWVSRR